MRIALTLMATFASLAIAAPALAQSLPRYDVESHCQEVADFSGGSSMLYNSCIDMEQQAYDGLKTQWSSIPSRMQDHCDQVASFTGGSYSLLESCIEMETDAAGNTSTFKY